MLTTTIHPDKIREVIGSGGKVINKLIADFGVKIDLTDEGNVYVGCVDKEAGMRAIKTIEAIAGDVEIGAIYDSTVTKIMAFGCFVEYLPGKEGLVHVSKLDKNRVENVEDVVKVGDKFPVKVLEVDKQGRINLSRKDA